MSKYSYESEGEYNYYMNSQAEAEAEMEQAANCAEYEQRMDQYLMKTDYKFENFDEIKRLVDGEINPDYSVESTLICPVDKNERILCKECNDN